MTDERIHDTSVMAADDASAGNRKNDVTGIVTTAPAMSIKSTIKAYLAYLNIRLPRMYLVLARSS